MTIIGVVIYPACWYVWIYRKRNYSVPQTLFLVAVAYTAVCAVVLAFLFFGMFKPVLELLAVSASKPMAWLVVLTPFIALFFGLVAAGFIGVAYVAVAVPVAILHRVLLLKLFRSTASRA